MPTIGELWVYYVYSGTKGTSARPVHVPPMGELWVYCVYSRPVHVPPMGEYI